MNQATVLIAGGTGLIGARLSEMLEEKGYTVIHLSRTQNLEARFPAYAWDLDEMAVDPEVIKKADFVVNLAGAGVADKRWTEARKKIIIQSRVKSNELLLKAFEDTGHYPRAFLPASAMGYYGDRAEEWVDENNEPGSGFLSESVQTWEGPIRKAIDSQLRTFSPRIGMVLSTRGGALPQFLLSFIFFIGVYFGHGKQWYSWIHIDDLCRMFIWAMENEKVSGFYNAVSPAPHRNKEFTRKIGKALNKPFLLLPAPAFALRLFFGEMADAILSGAKVSCEKAKKAGFSFKHEELVEAIRDLKKRKV